MSEAVSHQRFTELLVWKQAREFKTRVYEIKEMFPPEERYSLTDQIMCSARPICSNISEGHGRFTYKDQLHFCMISRGSLSETLNHLIDAYDCKYINVDTLKSIEQKYTDVEKLLNGYITYLRNSSKGDKG